MLGRGEHGGLNGDVWEDWGWGGGVGGGLPEEVVMGLKVLQMA